MKFNTISRFLVVGMTAVGTAVVAFSHPNALRQGSFPRHSFIPASVPMSQVQEFKDASTILLNDLQKQNLAGMQAQKGVYIISKYVMRDFFDHTVYVLGKEGSLPSVSEAKPISPRDLACLHYAFDEGIDHVAKGSPASVSVNLNSISGKMTSKDMGLTPGQFTQAVAQYVDSHPLRFWNQARTGLASGR